MLSVTLLTLCVLTSHPVFLCILQIKSILGFPFFTLFPHVLLVKGQEKPSPRVITDTESVLTLMSWKPNALE